MHSIRTFFSDANDEALDGNLHKDWHRIGNSKFPVLFYLLSINSFHLDDLLNKVNGKYLINN